MPWHNADRLVVDGNNLLHALTGGIDPAALRQLLARLRATLPASVTGEIVLDGQPDPGAPMHVRVGPGLTVRHAGRNGADHAIVASVEALPLAARASTVVVTNDIELRARAARAGARAEPIAWLTERLGARPIVATDVRRTETTPSGPTAPGAASIGRSAAAGASAGGRRPSGPRPDGERPGGQGPGGRRPDGQRPGGQTAPRSGARSATSPGRTGTGPAHPDAPTGPTKETDATDEDRWHPGRGATKKRGNPRRSPRRRGRPPSHA